MIIEGMIWDIDGVVLDSEELHAETESETAKAFGIDVVPAEVINLYSGVPIETEFAEMSRRANKAIPIDQALAIRERILKKRLEGEISLIPHAREAIQALRGKYKLAFATSSEQYFVEPVMRRTGLLDSFDVCLYMRDVERPKPDPQIFLKAASLLEIDPSNVAVVEDSESGFKAAKAAGMLLIARKAHHNRNKDFSLADYVIEDLREIPRVLEQLKQ